MYYDLERRISDIHGFGMFTKDLIHKGVEFYQIPLGMVYAEPRPRCVRIADGRYVSDDQVLNWINHSCAPNSRLVIEREDPVLVSIRDILPYEEITVDYNQTEIQGVKVDCTCKSVNCIGYFNRL